MWERDGATRSLWQHSAPEISGGDQPLKDEAFDVAIIGAGITGMSLALLLQQQGKKCVVLEAQQRGFGTTGGTTAHLNTLMDQPYSKIIKDFGADAARMVHSVAEEAIGLIEYQIMQYRISCGFRRADAYLMAENEAEEAELESIRTSAATAGLETFYTKDIHSPFHFSKTLQVPKQACFHPLQYLAGITEAFESLGGVLYEHARVWEAEQQEGIYRVQSSRGTLSAQHVVYATHIPTGINLLHLRCMPWRSYVLAAELEGDYPEGLYYDMKDPYHYYRSQQVNGKSYLVAGGKDHRTGAGDNTAHHFTTLEAELRKHFRVAAITDRWSSQYYESADGLPYIGHLPGAPERSWVATGFGGNGMIYSQVAARLLADEICGKVHPAHDLFSPARVKAVAGFRNFVQHNAHVAAEVISRFFRTHEEAELASLAPGEAKVLSVEGHTVAVHKDDAGKAHAVHAHCSHMGCDLKWNYAERSWDCPCHGARFDADGQVLNAPASAALQEITLFTGSSTKTGK